MTNIPAATPCVRQHVKPQHYGRFDNSSAATTSHLDVQKLKAGQWVFRQGDPRVAILEVVEGTLALIYRIGDDCEQIVEFAKPGILLGVECEQSYSVSARCISEVQIRPISIGEFNSSASLQLRSSKQLCQRLHALRTHVVRLGRSPLQPGFLPFYSISRTALLSTCPSGPTKRQSSSRTLLTIWV